MIAFVKGTISEISALGAVIEVGGVGMNLVTSANALKGKKIGDLVQIPTVMIVREDAMTLYGFEDDNEKEMFLKSIDAVKKLTLDLFKLDPEVSKIKTSKPKY